MIDKCPFCGEKMSYAGPIDYDEYTQLGENDSYCLHCGYRFDEDETREQMGRYDVFGDPYQVDAARDAGQLALL